MDIDIFCMLPSAHTYFHTSKQGSGNTQLGNINSKLLPSLFTAQCTLPKSTFHTKKPPLSSIVMCNKINLAKLPFRRYFPKTQMIFTTTIQTAKQLYNIRYSMF